MKKEWENFKTAATAFETSVIILEVAQKANVQINDKDIRYQYTAQTLIPLIVLKSFSCELLLKSIISYEKHEVPKIHNLKKLYYRLNGKTQNIIKEIVLRGFQSIGFEYNEKFFKYDLASNANLFEDWRYFFEKSVSANTQFVDILQGVLSKYTSDLINK